MEIKAVVKVDVTRKYFVTIDVDDDILPIEKLLLKIKKGEVDLFDIADKIEDIEGEQTSVSIENILRPYGEGAVLREIGKLILESYRKGHHRSVLEYDIVRSKIDAITIEKIKSALNFASKHRITVEDRDILTLLMGKFPDWYEHETESEEYNGISIL